MTLFTPMQQRLSACLAILAVLLLFVAPVVSQDLMARQSSAMRAAMAYDAMPMTHHSHARTSHDHDMVTMAHHEDAATAHHAMPMAHHEDAATAHHAMPMTHHQDAATAHHAMSMADAAMMPAGHMMDSSGFACGYCELLVHVPLMIWAAVPLIWLMMIVSRAPPPLRAVSPPRRRERRVYRPRAPPCCCRA